VDDAGTNVIFVIAVVFAAAAILTVIAVFVAAWWDNNPRVTVRRGSKSFEFDGKLPDSAS
jgi:hypothetical protein